MSLAATRVGRFVKTSGRKLRILPDAERAEQAMVDAALERGLVDASRFWTLGELIERLEGASHLGRAPCSNLCARLALFAAARALPVGALGRSAAEPAFARSALELLFELKSGGASPRELKD